MRLKRLYFEKFYDELYRHMTLTCVIKIPQNSFLYFIFLKKNVLLHESMSYMICVFIHGDAILMKDVDDLILR